MSELDGVLVRSRRMIEEALADARTELDAMRARQAELEEQIARAEAALGEATGQPRGAAAMTLHDALAEVLRTNGNDWMTVRELVAAVTEQGLYRKRDGGPVDVNQVHARTGNYSAVFEKNGGNIRLREESPMLAGHPQSVMVFRDDDAGFFSWLEQFPEGYFLNSERNPRPLYLVLHRPSCSHFKGSPELHWTKDYVKLCSLSREDLEEWASGTVGGEPTLCGSCFG
jgi:hypothetical protein